MSTDYTQHQSDRELEKAKALSLQRTRPPLEVPGYEAQKFLGSGAYGEVWVAVDQNTSRQVAIKFYTHKGGLDWTLLQREVEKLVLLSADPYVVQLLDVGWNANPPYYVMEYIENGSLDDHLRETGPLPVGEALEIFRGVCTGLMHAHGKGILHCDLKPGNVLLDHDGHPRLADFGQSRMSHDQSPALGTLFYMAPEQADLEAVPDARWDVYALGALLCTMVTGAPPHRTGDSTRALESANDLEDRLARYRQLIGNASNPPRYRQWPDIDGALADILDRCLAYDPEERYANVQGVVDALRAREESRAHWPLLVLGLVGPALLLVILSAFGWHMNNVSVRETEQALETRADEGNQWAAQFVAETVGNEIERYYVGAEQAAVDAELRRLVAELVDHPEIAPLLADLADPRWTDDNPSPSLAKFVDHPARQPLQQYLDQIIRDPTRPVAASWFVTDARGTQIAASHREQKAKSIGRNLSWRSYFHGGSDDLAENERPRQAITGTNLSAVYQAGTSNTWKVAVSAPLYRGGATRASGFLGIIALSIELGDIVDFDSRPSQQAVLIDNRPGLHKGMILQHPLFRRLLGEGKELPVEFGEEKYRVDLDRWAASERSYVDPLERWEHPDATPATWLAVQSPVTLRRGPPDASGLPTRTPTGLVVVVQEDLSEITLPVREMADNMFRLGLLALGTVIVVVTGLWFFVARVLRDGGPPPKRRGGVAADTASPLHAMQTVEAPTEFRKS